MSTNYSEQIFQSIDAIISQRLSEVSFDKTEICEIISQDKINKNKYWVSNGSLKYEAYSADENREYLTDKNGEYLTNRKVYVTIPQGNYELRKLIIGSYSADEIPKNLYVNPFNHLVTSSTLSLPSSIWAKVNDEEYDDWDDVPSDSTKPNSVEFLTNFNYKNTQDFDYIGLDFSFNTNIVGYQGSYALKISLWNGDIELTNKDDNTLILSSKNLYGNPYNLNSSLSFQHLFPWPTREKDDKVERIPIAEITKIKLQLIQDNNFLKQQGEINVNTDTWIELTKADLKFGYDVKNITKDELQLILEDGQSLKYTTGQTAAARNLYLDWKHFDIFNNPYIFNIHQSPNIFEYYKVYWLHYVDGLGKNADLPDEYAWNWETIINNTGLTQDIALTTLYRTDQYKAVIKYKYQNNETIYYAESTGLIFENTQVTAQPGATNNSDESLRLSLAKGDTGIYNIYGLDGRMVDTSKKNHTITAAFLDKTSWNDKKIETVIWKFPDSNTMILNGIQDSNNKNKATFDINSYYKPGAMNNRIWCEVKFVTGEIRRGSLTLQFGEISTAGTSYAFNIDFVGHNTCVYANNTNKVKIKATFEKVNGEVMTIPTITWSWVTSNGYKNNNPLISGSGIKIEGSGDEIELSYSGTTVPSENYSILQATIENYAIDNGLTSNLTAYLPIPIAYQDYNYISGATRLVYAMDNQSVSKSNDDYRLYQINDKKETIEVENTSWYITSHPSTLDGIPELREITEKIGDKEITRYTIRPVSYTSSYIPLVNINCVIGENIVWSQPILILSNAWESDEINDWNGAIEIDENDGNIKAPFFVAGKKEKVIEDGQPKNRLTGLVIGDLEKASVASGTGIYGFYQGRPRYYLTDSGKFYVGKDNNFISFNEGFDGRSKKDELLIKTQSFILDTDKLNIDSTANNDEAVIRFSDKFELRANGTATIGGWNIEKDGFSHNSNKYYLGQGLSNQTVGDHSNLTLAFKAGNRFGVATDGTLYAKDGKFSGDISGSTGTFNGDISTAGSISVSGTLTVTGTGTIAGWTIDNNVLKSNNSGSGYRIAMYGNQTASNAWVFQAGTSSQVNFYIRNDGYLYAQGGGTIAGWTIDSNSIRNGNTTLSADGNGTITTSNITIKGGSISIIKSDYFFEMGVETNHPSCSGLNVGFGGINMNGQGMSSDGNKWTISGGVYSNYITANTQLVSNTDAYLYGKVHANNYVAGGNINLLAGGSTGAASGGGILIRSYGGHITLDARGSGTSLTTNKYVYARGGSMSESARVKVEGGEASSQNVKTNIVMFKKQDYLEALQLLSQLDIYSYDYKYNIYRKKEQYGFIIDKIQEIQGHQKFFDFRTEIAKITERLGLDYSLEDESNTFIEVKHYDENVLDKYLLTICKALQQEVEELKQEIKELKQNEI